jgi:tRNA (mo5U34)-methyltransferase
MPWPESLAGLRCLDIGTMDGFWAFEMERRGAAEVVATDLAHSGEGDPFGHEPRRGIARGETFAVAAELLGSRAEYRHANVYDLDPAELGEFDLVFMGYVLQMLRDPMRGLDAVRRVCRGSLIVLETVSGPLSLLPGPIARLDARQDGREWFVFNRRGLRKALDLARFDAVGESPIFRDHAGPAVEEMELSLQARALHALGLRGLSYAVRARPRT